MIFDVSCNLSRGNPNVEIRNKLEIKMKKNDCRVFPIFLSAFRISDLFRISTFVGFRISSGGSVYVDD